MSNSGEETTVQPTGAVRSSDANSLDFTSLPLVGLIGVARTAAEGAEKYGRLNYMRGFTVPDLLNHTIRHITLYLLGDRSEPHLEHSAWGALAAVQSSILDPELSAAHLLGPGAKLSSEALDLMAKNEPALSAARKRGDFAASGAWSLKDLPEIKRILADRTPEVKKNPERREHIGAVITALEEMRKRYESLPIVCGTRPNAEDQAGVSALDPGERGECETGACRDWARDIDWMEILREGD